jgi:hypothetical protein
VNGDVVRPGEELVELLRAAQPFDPERRDLLRRELLDVEREHAHPEDDGAACELLAARSEADEPERRPRELLVQRAVHDPRSEAAFALAELLGEEEHEEDDVLGEGNGAEGAGGVREADPLGEDVVDVGVVESRRHRLPELDSRLRTGVDHRSGGVTALVDRDPNPLELRPQRALAVEDDVWEAVAERVREVLVPRLLVPRLRDIEDFHDGRRPNPSLACRQSTGTAPKTALGSDISLKGCDIAECA